MGDIDGTSFVPENLKQDAVERACMGSGIGNDRGECIEWRGHDWVLADWRQDGNHVHLTLTAPRRAQYRPSTNDG